MGVRSPEARTPPADLEAVDVGELEVEEDRVGGGDLERPDRRGALLVQLGLVALEAQRARQRVADGRVVLDDEDPHDRDPAHRVEPTEHHGSVRARAS